MVDATVSPLQTNTCTVKKVRPELMISIITYRFNLCVMDLILMVGNNDDDIGIDSSWNFMTIYPLAVWVSQFLHVVEHYNFVFKFRF